MSSATPALTLDERRRRVQNETIEHRSRKGDPLSIRSGVSSPRPTNASKTPTRGSSTSGYGDVATTWNAKEAVRELYAHGDKATPRE